jgi:PAS domain S-box-containing protein
MPDRMIKTGLAKACIFAGLAPMFHAFEAGGPLLQAVCGILGLVAVCLLTARPGGPVSSGSGGALPAWPAGGLAVAAVVLPAHPARRRAENRVAAFSNLGRRLSAVRTPREAAQIIIDTADTLCGWDACVLDLCSTDSEAVTTVLCIDTLNGQRTEIVPDAVSRKLSPLAGQVMKQGAQLVLRPTPAVFPPEIFPFGDKTRPSASLMYVPVRKDSTVIGLLSIQSYTPNAYTREDLRTLQALADHCGGALERIRAEAALGESNERLRLVLAAGKMGTWTREINDKNQIIGSPELDAILGLRPGEFAGTEQALFEFIHPDDHDLIRQAFARAIEAKTDYEVEFRFLPRNRPMGWMLGRGRAYYNAEGKPVRIVGVTIDITARKAAEQEASRLNAELERRVRTRTVQLEATNRELEAFAYSVSHDLRAPLRSICGFSEVLLERCTGQLDALGQEYLQRVCASGRHMERIIEDLLKLSRVGQCALRWQMVNLSALAESLAAELHKAEPGRAVEFVIAPHLQAEGDERLLRVALDNLLRNAWKFTSRKAQARIEFGFAAEPEPAFFVRDNGVGFDPAYARKLFGVFQRLHSASEFPGTGVGLATVQRIINRHSGRLWATATVNQGATFYFTLPANGDYQL